MGGRSLMGNFGLYGSPLGQYGRCGVVEEVLGGRINPRFVNCGQAVYQGISKDL